jgi:protein-tyrosine phosphatase
VKKVQHYQVQEGLLAGEYPGSFAAEITADRLEELVAKGVRTFIDLTTPVDRLEPYETAFANFEDLDLRRFSHEIPDMNIPTSPAVMRGILDRIRSEMADGRDCYVHCWGGIGRTGTVIGCWLKESGMDSLSALDEVQRRYFAGMEKSVIHPRSPQTPVQVRYVRDWPDV